MLYRSGTPVAADLAAFARWPDARSWIVGLGGTGPAPASDPGLIFHTCFFSFDPGPFTVVLRFTRLTATCGGMVLRVLSRSDASDDVTVQATTLVDLPAIAGADGRHEWPVMARPGHAYAFAGSGFGESDAAAQGLAITGHGKPAGPVLARRLAVGRVAPFPSGPDPTGLIIDSPATLAAVRSQMCTAAQFSEPDYDRWLGLMNRTKHWHRKQWEYVWICRALEVMGCLRDGAKALGFGCGVEPLPAVFASFGVRVTATDLGAADRRAKRWQDTAQHLLSLDALADPAICAPDRFRAQVDVAAVDMNAIPADRTGYDFCWSSCALEHLGSIAAGLTFIERSLATLRPGGVAVHTTEFNLTSNGRTVDHGGTVLFRRRDLESFARRMTAAGHHVVPMTFDQGEQPEDRIVDVAPYAADVHLKLALRSHVTTSFGLAIRKAG